jgi:hypothetical protein
VGGGNEREALTIFEKEGENERKVERCVETLGPEGHKDVVIQAPMFQVVFLGSSEEHGHQEKTHPTPVTKSCNLAQVWKGPTAPRIGHADAWSCRRGRYTGCKGRNRKTGRGVRVSSESVERREVCQEKCGKGCRSCSSRRGFLPPSHRYLDSTFYEWTTRLGWPRQTQTRKEGQPREQPQIT